MKVLNCSLQITEGLQAVAGGDRLRHAREEAGRGAGVVHGPGVLGGTARDGEAEDLRAAPAGPHLQVQEELPGASPGEGGPVLPVQVQPCGHRHPGRHHGDHRQPGRGRQVQGSGQDGRRQETPALPGERTADCQMLCVLSRVFMAHESWRN